MWVRERPLACCEEVKRFPPRPPLHRFPRSRPTVLPGIPHTHQPTISLRPLSLSSVLLGAHGAAAPDLVRLPRRLPGPLAPAHSHDGFRSHPGGACHAAQGAESEHLQPGGRGRGLTDKERVHYAAEQTSPTSDRALPHSGVRRNARH